MDHADDSAGLSSLAPIVPEPDSRRILEVAHPDVDWEEPTWIGLHPRAGTRLARRRLRILIAVAVAAGVGLSPWALLLMLPAPWIWLSSHRWARASAMAITPTAVFYRSGWLARSLSVVRYRKGQTVSISTSPFDRRWKMATLSVDTGRRPGPWATASPCPISPPRTPSSCRCSSPRGSAAPTSAGRALSFCRFRNRNRASSAGGSRPDRAEGRTRPPGDSRSGPRRR
jgi:hypothetical protein